MVFWRELQRRNVFRVAAAYVVLAWLIIQVAETILPVFQVPDVFLRGAIILLALGFPVAVFLAWAFELTPEGIKREQQSDDDQPVSPRAGRKLDRIIIVVLLLAVGYFVADKYWLDAASRPEASSVSGEENAAASGGESVEKNSLAVLAFDDMSKEGDQGYLADGIAEELLNLLARIPNLRLTSRSSSFSYKDKDVSLRQIAEELAVAYVLEGSVRKVGDQVRITAQLIDARTDSHVWSRTYDRKLDDIFAIQDEIAASVVDQLKVTLLGAVPTTNKTDPEAYELFLRARHLSNMVSKEALSQAQRLYREALEIDPDFVDARLGLAVTLTNQVGYGLRSANETIPRVREILERVLTSHPDHALANSLRGWIAMSLDNDWPAAAKHFRRSLETAPTDTRMLSNAGTLLHALGRFDKAIAVNEYVSARDPLSPTVWGNLSLVQYDAGRFDDSISAAREAMLISPDYLQMHYRVGSAFLQQGAFKQAAEAFRQEPSERMRALGLAMVAYQRGPVEAFERRRAEWLDRWGERFPVDAARLFAYVGDEDRAFEWLDHVFRNGMADLFVWSPEFASLHDDPRWQSLLEHLGLAPAQRAAIDFKVALPDQA